MTRLSIALLAFFALCGATLAQHDNHPSPSHATNFLNQPNGAHVFDGDFREAGVWTGTGGNVLRPTNMSITPRPTGCPDDPTDTVGGFGNLTVPANVKEGAEIQTVTTPGYGYGFYAARMFVSPVSGSVASIFWIAAPNYGPQEWDIEFLTNEPVHNKVHFTLHPSNATFIYTLPFNWDSGYHDYGFLWTPGQIIFTVDRQPVHTMTGSELTTSVKGFIMANVWTGNPNWGGGPPTSPATTCYSYIRFWDGVTTIP